MTDVLSVDNCGIVSRDRVTDLVRTLLRSAILVERRFTVDALAALSHIKPRSLRAYMSNDPGELREPSLSAALSIVSVLGPRAVNAVIALIGYGGAEQTDEPEGTAPGLIVAELIDATSVVARAAADGRFDHVETPGVKSARSRIILAAMALPGDGE
jgi:hypothetical protein